MNATTEDGLSLSFSVTYHRSGDTNAWTAQTIREKLMRNVTAEGAFGYSTALWEDQCAEDVSFVTVAVLLPVDDRFDNENIFILPSVWPVLTGQARKLADDHFRSHHADAVIEHDNS